MSLSKEQVQESLSTLDKALGQVDAVLAPVLARPLSDTVKGMSPLESAKLQVTLAYTMNTLYYRTDSYLSLHPSNTALLVYMRLQNANLVGHEIVKDMDRLKQYMKKIQEAESRLASGNKEATAGLRLDKPAAKRFVQHAIAESTAAAEKEEVEVGEDEEAGSEQDSGSSDESE